MFIVPSSCALLSQEFLAAEGLRLIVRSHEGPDARLMRDDMGPMDEGYTIDHVTESEREQRREN